MAIGDVLKGALEDTATSMAGLPGVGAAAAGVGAAVGASAQTTDLPRLIFGARKMLSPQQVFAAGGTILQGGDNTPPSAVLPDGSRLFALDPENDPAYAAAAHAAEIAEQETSGGVSPLGADSPDGESAPASEDEGDEGIMGMTPHPPSSFPSEDSADLYATPQRPAAGAAPGAPGDTGAPAPDATQQPDQLQDLIQMMKAEMAKPMPGFPGMRPLSTGDHIALGIIGGLDPEAFNTQILPMLEKERSLPMAQAEWERGNHQQAIQMMQILGNMMQQQQERQTQAAAEKERVSADVAREKHAMAQESLQAQGQMRAERHAKAMEDIARERNTILAKKGLAPKPLDPGTKRDLALARQLEKQAQAALAYLHAHPSVGLPGAGLGTYFSKEFSDFDAMLGDLKTTFATARAGKRITAPELKLMGGSLTTMNQTQHQKVSSLEEILRWAQGHEDAIKYEFNMEGAPGEEQSGPPDPAAAPPGLTPVGDMQIDDDLLEGR